MSEKQPENREPPDTPQPPAGPGIRSHTLLLALLAAASLGTTALIALTVIAGRSDPALRGGAIVAPQPENLPVLVTLPKFELIDQSGQPFGSEQLAGHVWVANFIFTRCSGPCPMMTSRMAKLQGELDALPAARGVHLVSLSVDPSHDKPAELAEYAKMAHAGDRWHFLTGTREQVWDLSVEGFKLPVGENPENQEMPILHSQKFILVDGQGQVRGYYDGLEPEGMESLRRDVTKLIEEQG